ncbi:hydroxycarboxylic acid receptor 2-like [Periophthalmus magnuspinnatus]|uniref:hydroxycarboxylic acid receptor 2-like n=1 Tax=Periophthalmus magnuspinnatus TaxID=409849 RepID=UPI002437009A|nr:hydroxycarboxylic acid receptor 2-like [Periophthalmus magnuspinnatus]
MNSSEADSVQVNATSHPLWYLYPVCEAEPFAFVFYYGVKVLNLVVGTPCNLLVIWHIASRKSDASTSDIFILNLAVLDAYFCLMTPIDLVNRLLLGNGRIWSFQRFAYGVKDSAPLFLVCICLDRYMAVVHPVVFSRVRDNKLRVLVSVLVWGLVLSYGLAKSLVYNFLVQFELFTAIILLAFGVMLFSNVSIIWVLRRSVAGKEEMHPVKKRAFRMVLIILAIIVVNYLPPVALMPFASRYSFIEYHCKIVLSVYLIMDLSSSIEPLVYITKMEGAVCCGHQTKGPDAPTTG